MKKKEYTTPQTHVILVAPQQMICASLSAGSRDDEEQPDQDEYGYYLAE